MRKLTLSLIAVVLLATVGLGWGIGRYYAYLIDSEANDPHSSTDMLTGYRALGALLADNLHATPYQHRRNFVMQWRDANRADLDLLDGDNFPLPESLREKFVSGDPIVLESEGEFTLHYFIRNEDNARKDTHQVMALTVSNTLVGENSTGLNVMLTLLFYAGIIIVVLIWLSPLIRRLNNLQKIAVKFGEGELSARVEVKATSYIADIENEFNHMAERIQTLVGDNKLLSRAVSHDLKTPLARLRFGIETLEEAGSEELRAKYHSRIEEDLTDMELLVETLLEYARLDEASIKVDASSVVLPALARNIAAKLQTPRTVFTVSVEDECVVLADKKYLTMALTNLAKNAANYGQSQVLISIKQRDDHICISVEDDGPGIVEHERSLVVKPFARGKAIGEKKGHGMGLAIAYRIADWHGANMHILDSETLGGARVDIVLPKPNI